MSDCKENICRYLKCTSSQLSRAKSGESRIQPRWFIEVLRRTEWTVDDSLEHLGLDYDYFDRARRDDQRW